MTDRLPSHASFAIPFPIQSLWNDSSCSFPMILPSLVLHPSLQTLTSQFPPPFALPRSTALHIFLFDDPNSLPFPPTHGSVSRLTSAFLHAPHAKCPIPSSAHPSSYSCPHSPSTGCPLHGVLSQLTCAFLHSLHANCSNPSSELPSSYSFPRSFLPNCLLHPACFLSPYSATPQNFASPSLYHPALLPISSYHPGLFLPGLANFGWLHLVTAASSVNSRSPWNSIVYSW
mmetsp:Transcript_36832/g.77758  ORF Transcript_36832/g.77758 Transcript_36832/m.77758 type:complete len:230 (-) Transcript_36832:753-1442(-)